jgi:hypothetical protein
MPGGLPKSKSAATVCARNVRAVAEDLRTAAASLDESAKLYEGGDYDNAHFGVTGARSSF